MLEIKIPSPGESVTEAELASWLVKDGDIVHKNQEIAEIESDKATLTLTALEGGQIKILVQEGEIVEIGTTACTIDSSKAELEKEVEKPETKGEEKPEAIKKNEKKEQDDYAKVKITPLAKKKMEEHGLNVEDIISGLRRISKKDVEKVVAAQQSQPVIPIKKELSRESFKKKMSQLRQKISKRLVAVKNETAMLTTFNEADMSKIISLRKKYKEAFAEKHCVKLGLMSFFIKSAAFALQQFPKVNSMLDGNEIVSYNYADIGIAVQTPKGLMVPIIRNAETMSLAAIEQKLGELAEKAREAKISLDEMTGGTFTITNGGVFGSLLSTPIINPPQSAILGMHNIVERPVAVNGKVEIRPMMYLAVSYDHRVVDGKESVSFLLKIKELIETPIKMLPEGESPKLLLEL